MSDPSKSNSPPWLNDAVSRAVTPRDGDIWISVPAKSGTNWTMNIVHQLLSGGSDDFDSIYSVVPWPAFVERPGQPAQEVLDRVAAMPAGTRRAFKTHAAPPAVPFVRAGQGTDVKYIAVCRNPEESLVSFKVFLEQHTDAFYNLWQVPKAAMTRPDFVSFYNEVAEPKGMHGMCFGFLSSWWPLRHEPNVLLTHFGNLKRDLSGSLRAIATFLGVEPSDAAWQKIEEHTSFAWMKQNQRKFEVLPHTPVPVLESGAMMRKGKLGAAREDGMTEDIAHRMRAFGSRILSDEAALRWLYEGGPLP